jgi:hypothetical protein
MYYDDATIITSGNSELYEKHHLYIGKIIPNRLIKNKNLFEITFLDKVYFINGFDVVTENDKVRRVHLFGFHPNREDNGLYCLPDEKKNKIFTEEYFNILLSNIKTYYFDSCYFKPPPQSIKFTKLKSIYVQLNQGD